MRGRSGVEEGPRRACRERGREGRRGEKRRRQDPKERCVAAGRRDCSAASAPTTGSARGGTEAELCGRRSDNRSARGGALVTFRENSPCVSYQEEEPRRDNIEVGLEHVSIAEGGGTQEFCPTGYREHFPRKYMPCSSKQNECVRVRQM
jgi:hypothetical protein